MSPTVFHVTHWKSGSQWIHKILSECAPDRIVAPQLEMAQVLRMPIQQGAVYPTVYLTCEELAQVELPPNTRRFVVIRDLRDTLVSYYYSLRFSHAMIAPSLAKERARLQSVSVGAGLLYVMKTWLPLCSRIQESWLAAGEKMIRYEDLLEDDLAILSRVLVDECELTIDHDRFSEIVLANRFEHVTGRCRGTEDQLAHERKGIAGDWRGYLHGRVKTGFKRRYGELLVATGYEQDLSW